MRDLIWTLIVVWLIYRIVEIFRYNSAKKSFNTDNRQAQSNTIHNTSRPEKDIRKAIKKHLNNEGEYIDFEEVK